MSPEKVQRHAVWLALARASFGAPAVAAPETVARLLGLTRRSTDDGSRFFGGFFGVRELLLGGFILVARRDPAKLAPAVLFGALADLGDTAFLVREVARRGRLEPATASLLSSGVAGSAASIALWWEVRQAGEEPVAAA